MNLNKFFSNSRLVLFTGILLVIALGGAWLVRIHTPFGMGMLADSVSYVMGARNILAGNGFSQFSGTDGLRIITMFPPLYSYVLAFIGLSGLDVIRAARLLNIVLMGLDLLLFAGLIYYETRNKLLSILASLLFLSSAPLFVHFTWALTEPLYFTLLFGNFVLYYRFLQTQKAGWAAALGCGTALLFLTRYVGIFMAAVWLPAILLVSIPKSKLKNAMLYLAGLLPLMVYNSLRNYLGAGTPTSHDFYSPGMSNASAKLVPGLSALEGLFTLTGEGLASHTASLIVLCLVVVALLAGLILSGIKLYKQAGHSGEQPDRQAVLFPLMLALPLYLVTMLLSIYFFDSNLLLDDRHVSPLCFFGLYLLVLLADLVIKKGRFQRLVTYVFLLAVLVFSVGKFQKVSVNLRSDGEGFFSASWRDLPGIEYVRQTNHTLIYSDEPLAVYILTGKVTYQVPFTEINNNRSYQENYQHFDFMRDRLFESDGIMVLFGDGCHNPSDVWYQALVRDLIMIEEFADTCVYAP